MNSIIEINVGGGTLRVVSLQKPDDIALSDYREGKRRLLFVVATSLLLDDPLSRFVFEKALGPRGRLEAVDTELPVLVYDIIPAADWASEQLSDGAELVVACIGIEPPLVAASVLVAVGLTPPEAISAIEAVIPGAFGDLDLEVGVSVLRDRFALWRDLCRRRLELVQQGRSPWEAR